MTEDEREGPVHPAAETPLADRPLPAESEAADRPLPAEAETDDRPSPAEVETDDRPSPAEVPPAGLAGAPEPAAPLPSAEVEAVRPPDSEPAPTDEDSAALPAQPEPQPVDAEPEAAAPPPRVRRSVAGEIARQLYAAGARYCFTVPAEPILPLLDELAAAGIRVVTARHEGSAAFMAEALTQSSGRPQVVAVSRAVGAANAAIGIHTAHQDSAPLVALLGQVASRYIGREAFQEADLVAGIGSMAAWAAQIDAPSETVDVLGTAWRRLHSGRPGPLVVSVPLDVQAAELELVDAPPPKPAGARGPAADRSAVSRALKMLASSERGLIVAGGGVLRARATKRLLALSEALAVPVVAAWRRPDVFPNDHANYLGMAGSWAAPTVAARLADADVILFVGTRLSEMTTMGYAVPAAGTRWIHVDVQPRVAGAGLAAPTLSIAADASRFLDSAWSDLRAVALDGEMRSRREARMAADREAYRAATSTGQGTWQGPGVDPRRVVEVLRSVLPDNAVVATDAGNLAAFLVRHYRFRRAGTFLGATSGAMGYGLPAAIAASLQDPDRIALAVCGDGGFAATMHELETAVREGAHPVAVVLDNQRYGTTSTQQTRESRSSAATDLGAIDFAAVARAHGALGFEVAQDAAFEPALREAIGARGTSVIHVRVDRAWRSVDDHPFSPAQ